MSERKNIIREFSTFRIVEDRNGHKIPVLRSDRELERIIDSLAHDADLRANKDAWARYFLLVRRQSDPQPGASLSISAPSDCVLQHIIKHLVELAPESNKDVQVVHLGIIARQNDQRVASFLNNPISSAERLLSDHLQKVCWYAAKDFYEKRIQFSNLRYQYPSEECLQIASLRASAPINLLQNFNFEYRHITIKSYAEKRFWGIISDKIRAQNLDAKTRSFSDEWLLKTLAKKELMEASNVTKNYQIQIICYCLALQSYKEIYQQRQINYNQITPPTEEQLQQILTRYNQRRQEFDISESVGLNDIKAILNTCTQVVRSYRSCNSFTRRIYDDSSQSITDPWYTLVQDEETLMQNEEIAQVRLIITRSFAEIPDVAQQALKLWFGLGLTQSDILIVLVRLLGLQKQYEVSRRIKQYKKPLVKALLQELSEKHPQRSQPKNRLDEIIIQIQEPIDECLSQHCKQFFYLPLKNQLKLFEHKEKLLLCLHYRQHLQEKQISEQLQILASEVTTQIANIEQSLQGIFKQWVETTLDIALGLCSSADQKLASFVKRWLQDHATLEV